MPAEREPGSLAAEVLARLRDAFARAAVPADAEGAARYLKDQFPFFGVRAPLRRRLAREQLRGLEPADAAELAAVARALWAEPERELQHTACDIVRARIRVADPGFIDVLEDLITSKSWWDTVDTLAAHGVGPLARRYPQEVLPVLDRWIESEDIWLARTSILHQLTYKEATDEERLFRYCERRAPENEFFIRKAIGWALRQHAATKPEAVAAFVAATPQLSGLSRREAMRGVERARTTG